MPAQTRGERGRNIGVGELIQCRGAGTEAVPRSKFLGWFELRWFFENLEQLLGTVHPVTFCAADFFDDALLLQLTNGPRYRVVSQAEASLNAARGDERICPQQIHHLKGNFRVGISGKFMAPAL